MNATAPIRDGEVIAEKYRVERTIGRGGMGFVVAATHLQLDQLVALKFVTASLFDSTEATQRFLREARTTFRLRSEHTVRMLDVGTLPSGQAFIVMELLEGQDLRQVLAANGPLPEADAARHVVQACSALDEAHALGIVHRDLKPSNLFVAKNAQGTSLVKVLDFGVSKVVEPGAEFAPLSRPEAPLGTPRYMAPEQWRSPGDVDARTDIYALGLTLYELLTGNVPLHGLPPDERRSRLLAGAIPSPRTLRPELRESICKVILRCLQTVPEGRYPSALHLASALKDAVPTAAPRPPRAKLSTTATTVVVPEALLARDAALAFADVTETQVDPPVIDVAAASTRHEFAGSRGARRESAPVAAAPASTQLGVPEAAPAPPAAPAPRRPPSGRLMMAPLRGRMSTPTLKEHEEALAAVLAAPPVAPPVEPMRPRMLTPTQNDPRNPTLNAAYAPAWHPSAPGVPAAPAVPAAAPPPVEVPPAPAPSGSMVLSVTPGRVPSVPPPAAVQGSWPPPGHPPMATAQPHKGSPARVVIAIVVAIFVGSALAAAALAYVVRHP